MKINIFFSLPLLSISMITLNLQSAATITLEETLSLAEINELLIQAAESGNTIEIEELIKIGANVNTADEDGQTPLMFAIRKGHKEAGKLLIDAGALIDSVNKKGNTALLFAVFCGRIDIVEFLLNEGANVNRSNEDGCTALIAASFNSKINIVKLLLNAGVDVDYADECKEKAALKKIMESASCEIIESPHAGYSLSHIDTNGNKSFLQTIQSQDIHFYRQALSDLQEIIKLIQAEPARRQAALARRQEIFSKLNETMMPYVLVRLINSYLPSTLADYIESNHIIT